MYLLRFCLSRPQLIEYQNLGADFKMGLPPEKYRISASNLTMFVDDSIPAEEAEKILLLYAYEYFHEDAPDVLFCRKIDAELSRRNIPHDPLDESKVQTARQALMQAKGKVATAGRSATGIPINAPMPKEELKKRIELLTAYLERVEAGNPENAARLAPMIYKQIQELHQQLMAMGGGE